MDVFNINKSGGIVKVGYRLDCDGTINIVNDNPSWISVEQTGTREGEVKLTVASTNVTRIGYVYFKINNGSPCDGDDIITIKQTV